MLTKQQFQLLVSNLAKLGARRLAIMAVVGLVVMLAVSAAAYYLARPAMQPIYTGLTPQDVTRMTAVLAEAGVSFDVNEARTAVLVAFGQAARARTLLAEKGLPTSARAGYELFDQIGSMGLTSFMQEVTRVRALEGEISRTIQALDGIAAARVHLVLPDSGSFRRDRRDPSASVVLRIDGHWQASAGQTVRHIVAAAVPGMKIEQVSVASTDGRMIAAGGDESELGSMKLAEMERAMASEIEQRAGRTLASTLGTGNFQVSATVRLDVDHQQVNETIFDPKSRVERSVRVVRQSGSTEDGSGRQAVGVEANVPREEASQTDNEKRRQREDRREELTNYELNSKQVQTVREGYRIQRLAIAVVVNRKQIAAQIGAGMDAQALDIRIAEIKKLVMAATGAATDRDDSIVVSAVDFGVVDGAFSPVSPPTLGDYAMMNLGVIINAAAMLVIVFLVVWFGLRPLVGSLARADDTHIALAAPAGEGAKAEASLPSSNPALDIEAPAPAPGAAGAAAHEALSKPRNVAIRERLEAVVAADDAKVVKVLKSWISEPKQA